jgi:hypothetical protein
MSDIFQSIKTCMSSGTMEEEDKTKFWAKRVQFRRFHDIQDAKRFASDDSRKLIQVGNTCMPVGDLVMVRIVNENQLEVKFAENSDTAKWLGPEFILRLIIDPYYIQDILNYFCTSERGNWKSDWTGKPF